MLAYFPDSGRVIASDICRTYVFNSYFTADLSRSDSLLYIKQSYNVGIWLLEFAARVLITIAVELVVALKMCIRDRGRFSTTVHVKDNVGRIEFINSFCGIMKNHGFVPCSDDEAEQSYVFAFGDGWVTLVNKDYKDDRLKAGDDAMNMSAALKTSAFMMDVIDSDFAYIHLFAPNGGKDGVAVGDTSGYGVEKPKRGKQKFWKPLLAEGKTWEQFSETVAKNAVFVEETLVEMAEELKIDPDYIYADFNELMNLAGENKNVQPFYFKNAAGKRVTLKAAFKRVFGEALEPLGFKLIKGKYPYFVRVVPGGEIIHIISYMEEWCPDRGKKAFNVIGGIATVYRHKIDLGVSPKDNCDWLYTIAKFYWMTTPKSEYDKEYGQSICHFMFDENSESSLYDAVNYTLEDVYKRQVWTEARKASCISYEPVPQTDTGRWDENSKTNGRRVVKELGKLSP